MAYAYPTLSDLRQRTAYLRGETDYTTVDATIDSHINWSIKDIILAFPFSCDITTTTGTLSSGTFQIAADFISKWHLHDARITGTSTGDDNIFREINISERDNYSSTDYVYWITYDTTNKRYIFNTHAQTGTVTYYYYFFPVVLSATSDTTIVSDAEAIAYLAASKYWIGGERDQVLAVDYRREAASRIQALWNADMHFGADAWQGTIIDDNPNLRG